MWLPHKLEQQVAILDAHPKATLVLGATEYWQSWAGNSGSQEQDIVQSPGVPANQVYEPPSLLNLLLKEAACVACPSDLLFRKEAIANLGGFEQSFIGLFSIYEDQAFLAKVYANQPVFVSDQCLDRYRLHADSICATTNRAGQLGKARIFFLNWTAEYLSSQRMLDADTRDLIRRQLWPHQHPVLHRLRQLGPRVVKKLKRLRT